MDEGLILTMDGSTSVCCAALLEVTEGKGAGVARVISQRSETNGRGQARVLLRQVDEMLREVGAEPGDMTKVIVGTGPGTFTGVRIAVATARALSLAIEIPVFGASTLSALAAWALDSVSAGDRKSWSDVTTVVDARRGQVFYASYESKDDAGAPEGRLWVEDGAIGVCDREGLAEKLRELRPGATSVMVGEEEVIGPWVGDVQVLASAVRAEYLTLGQERLAGTTDPADRTDHALVGEAEARIGTPESVKPIYVRAPDADVHITKMRDPWTRGGSRG